MVQLQEFLSGLLESLLKIGLHLMKNVCKLLAKIILIPWVLTAASSKADTRILNKTLGSIICPSDLTKWTKLTLRNN